MTITLQQRAALRKDGDFGLRLIEAITLVACEVIKEAAEVPNHLKRLKWARKSLKEIAPETRKVFNFLAADSTLSTKGKLVTDEELLTAVRQAVDLLTED